MVKAKYEKKFVVFQDLIQTVKISPTMLISPILSTNIYSQTY